MGWPVVTPALYSSHIPNDPMPHYLAAALLMVAAIGFPMLCVALGMKVNTRDDSWID